MCLNKDGTIFDCKQRNSFLFFFETGVGNPEDCLFFIANFYFKRNQKETEKHTP